MEHWRRKGVKCAPRDTSLSVNYCHMSPSLTFILPCVCICLTGKGKGRGVGSWGDSIYQIQIRIFFFLQRTTKQSCWKRKHMVADFGTKRLLRSTSGERNPYPELDGLPVLYRPRNFETFRLWTATWMPLLVFAGATWPTLWRTFRGC